MLNPCSISVPIKFRTTSKKKKKNHSNSYLIVSVAGNFDAGFPNFHINHQTLNYWQCILVISKVLGKSRLKWNKEFINGRI